MTLMMAKCCCISAAVVALSELLAVLYLASLWAVSCQLYCSGVFVILLFDYSLLSLVSSLRFLLFHQIAMARANVPVTALP